MVQHIVFLPFCASVEDRSIWDTRHLNRVVTRSFMNRQMQFFGMRQKEKGKNHRFGYMGKGKAKGTSKVDTNFPIPKIDVKP